jgi:hypothetical protein
VTRHHRSRDNNAQQQQDQREEVPKMNTKTVAVVPIVSIFFSMMFFSQAVYANDCRHARMTLNIQKYALDYELKNFGKKKMCIEYGKSYHLDIKQAGNDDVPIAIGGITVYEKPGDIDAIGSNDKVNPKSMTVTFGSAGDPARDHKFYIKVDGVGILDPIVRVVDNRAYLQAWDDAVQKLAEISDVDLARIAELRKSSD